MSGRGQSRLIKRNLRIEIDEDEVRPNSSGGIMTRMFEGPPSSPRAAAEMLLHADEYKPPKFNAEWFDNDSVKPLHEVSVVGVDEFGVDLTLTCNADYSAGHPSCHREFDEDGNAIGQADKCWSTSWMDNLTIEEMVIKRLEGSGPWPVTIGFNGDCMTIEPMPEGEA